MNSSKVDASSDAMREITAIDLTHAAPRKQPYETPSPVVKVKDIRWIFRPAGRDYGRTVRHRIRTGSICLSMAEIVLNQLDELHYTIEMPGQKPIEGTRSPGWLAVKADGKWTKFGVRHFWQNCPKELFVSKDGIGVRLWAGNEPFEWEGGLAKTHEVVLDLSPDKPETMHLDPLRAIMPPAWVCGTEAAGALMPANAGVAADASLLGGAAGDRHAAVGQRHAVRLSRLRRRLHGRPVQGQERVPGSRVRRRRTTSCSQFLRTGEPWYLRCRPRPWPATRPTSTPSNFTRPAVEAQPAAHHHRGRARPRLPPRPAAALPADRRAAAAGDGRAKWATGSPATLEQRRGRRQRAADRLVAVRADRPLRGHPRPEVPARPARRCATGCSTGRRRRASSRSAGTTASRSSTASP